MIIELDKIFTLKGTDVSPIFIVFEFKFNVWLFVVLLPILTIFIAVSETVDILSVSVSLIDSIEFVLIPTLNVSNAVAMSVSVFIRWCHYNNAIGNPNIIIIIYQYTIKKTVQNVRKVPQQHGSSVNNLPQDCEEGQSFIIAQP
jgi:hypothetical protein